MEVETISRPMPEKIKAITYQKSDSSYVIVLNSKYDEEKLMKEVLKKLFNI